MNFQDSELSLPNATLAKIAKVSPSLISLKKIAFDKQWKSLADSNESDVQEAGNGRKKIALPIIQQILSGFIRDEKPPIVKKIHVFYNFKGGTGKSSLCYQLSMLLTFMGFKVLAVDLDPQAHLSTALRVPENSDFQTLYDVIINGVDIRDTVKSIIPGLDAIPSNIGLTRVEVPLSLKNKRELTLVRALNLIKDEYDFILIDTNPAISILNINAMVAADNLDIVCETQPFSLNGLSILLDTLRTTFIEIEQELHYLIIPNKFESKTTTAQEILGILRQDYKGNMAQTIIRKSEDINISSKFRLPVFSFARKDSYAFEDCIDLAHEFIEFSRR